MQISYLVSVIIPVHNGARFIKQAIESVLNQSHTNLEIIVIDDGSIDNTKNVVLSFPQVNYHYQEHQGVASARNKALSMASGDFIAFLDADDFYDHKKLEIQLTYLQNNPAIDICFCHQHNFIEDGFSLSEKDYIHFMENEKIGLITMMVRKFVFEKVGFFNTIYPNSSDFDWVTRAKDFKHRSVILPDILLQRRVHDTNLTLIARKENNVFRFKILKDSIDRKRSLLNNIDGKN